MPTPNTVSLATTLRARLARAARTLEACALTTPEVLALERAELEIRYLEMGATSPEAAERETDAACSAVDALAMRAA